MFRPLIRIAIILLLPLAVGLMTWSYLHDIFLVPVNPANQQPQLVEVVPGKTFRDLARELEAKGLVKKWWSLDVLWRLSRKDAKIKAGEYQLTSAMTPQELLARLTSEEVFKRAVIVKDGMSIWDVGKLLENAGLVKEQEFNAALTDSALLKLAGIPGQSFEGYLFPQTYYFARPITPKAIIWRMLEEGEKNWPETFSKQAEEFSLSRHEILTLASMIEKETSNFEEQPIIASVFHNRINQAMPLQSDPTVAYGIPNFDGQLTDELRSTPHAYNTYTNPGLPPGPICNPGLTAIKAALFPQRTPYLFFVGDRNGKHVFSATLAEHRDALRKHRSSQPAAAPAK